MFWCKVLPNAQQPPADLSRNPIVLEMPETALYVASMTTTISQSLGFSASLERGKCMLGDGRPIPMMSYGLVEYLLGVDLADLHVLEIGGGDSTMFWSNKCASVLTLETDLTWAENLRARRLPNVETQYVAPEQLSSKIRTIQKPFDVIVVDPGANRYAAAKAALPLLKPGGFILLDNSDWYPNTAALLRDADLIQIDFPDFRPGRWFRGASSLFLHYAFRARPIPGKALPQPVIAGKHQAPVNGWDSITD